MKKSKILLGVAIIAIAGAVGIAADHIDAPGVSGGTSDITDFYAFQGQNTDNIAFVANVQGLLSPADTQTAEFDEDVMIEFNIDSDGDAIEDLVIQALPRDGKMYFFGPYAPTQAGTTSRVSGSASVVVDISSATGNAITASQNGMTAFAGPRDDPFFFDFAQYSEIIAGNATSFNSPGADTFAGTNVMSVVIEVPKSMLGSGASINSWVETKRKQ